MMINLSDLLTIICATKNRPYFIKRLIDYYECTEFKGHLIICDSSDVKELKLLKDFIKISSLNITFFHKKLILPRIITYAFNLTETKYACLLMDDDILLIEGINKSIEFLNANNEYVGATGLNYNFTLVGNSGASGKLLGFNTYCSFFTDSKMAKIRMKKLLETKDFYISSIFKKDVVEQAFKSIQHWPDYYAAFTYGEFYPGLIIAKAGPLKSLNVDFCIRQAHKGSHNRTLNFKKFFTSFGYEQVIYDFKLYLSSVFNKREVEEIYSKLSEEIFDGLYLKDKRESKFIFNILKNNNFIYALVQYYNFRFKNKNLRFGKEVSRYFKSSNIW